MKKLLLLFTFVLALGCSSDDDNPEEVDLFGDWTATETTVCRNKTTVGLKEDNIYKYKGTGTLIYYYHCDDEQKVYKSIRKDFTFDYNYDYTTISFTGHMDMPGGYSLSSIFLINNVLEINLLDENSNTVTIYFDKF